MQYCIPVSSEYDDRFDLTTFFNGCMAGGVWAVGIRKGRYQISIRQYI